MAITTYADQFLGPTPIPSSTTQLQPTYGPPAPTVKPTAVQTSDAARTNYNNALSTANTADQAMKDQLIQNGTRQANQLASDPIIGPAQSNTSFQDLIKTNPAAAYYRGYGVKPTADQLQAFVAQFNPPPKPSAADALAAAVNNANAVGNPNVNSGTPSSTGATDSSGNPLTIYDANGKPINTGGSGTTPPNPITDAQQKLDDLNAKSQQALNDFNAKLAQITQGTYPLSSAQQAQIDSIQAIYNQAIDQQKIANANYEGGISEVSIARGLSRYAPELALGRQQAAVTSGLQKIVDLQNKAASTIATLKQGFMKDDYDMISKAYDSFTKQQDDLAAQIKDTEEKTITFQNQIRDDARTAANDYYNQVTKPIQDIAAEAAKNGASPTILAKINSAKNVTDAINAAGDSLQTGTGQLGDYLQYKRDAQANNQAPMSYGDWKVKDDEQKNKLEVSKAYATAFASASGRIAGENKASGDNGTGNNISSPVSNPNNGVIFNIPSNLAPFVNFSNNGVKYLDFSGATFSGLPAKDKAALESAANKAGIRWIDNKNTAVDVQNITNAALNLKSIQEAFDPNAPASAAARNIYGANMNKLTKFLQTNPSLAAIDSYSDAGLDILKAVSGIQGFRGGQSAIDQVKNTLPQIGDTQAVVDQKIKNIQTLLNNRETTLVGKPSATDQALYDAANADKTVTSGLSRIKTSNPQLWKTATAMYTSNNPITGQPYSAEDVLQAFPELK